MTYTALRAVTVALVNVHVVALNVVILPVDAFILFTLMFPVLPPITGNKIPLKLDIVAFVNIMFAIDDVDALNVPVVILVAVMDPVVNPVLIRALPFTSKVNAGLVVAIPTFPPVVIMLPKVLLFPIAMILVEAISEEVVIPVEATALVKFNVPVESAV